MIRFKSVISRIVILHVIAVALTSILMSLALSWLLNLATDNIHDGAMERQAMSVADRLIVKADGSLSLELPPDLQGLYSQPYGRYFYAVIDDSGKTLFSSSKERTPIFPTDPSAAAVRFHEIQKVDAVISGASIRRVIGNQAVWIQAAEDLANRDVLIDDIVADFFKKVGWITLPILLVLLVIDIAIFRRALLPLRQASEIAQHIGPTRTDVRLPVDEIPDEVRPLVLAVNLALDRLDQGFRVQREFTGDAAHELRTPLSILRTRVDIAQSISVPIPTTQNFLLPPWARIASRLRAHPAGLTLLLSEQTFQEQTCIRRNTLLREQRTYPFLDFPKRRRPQRKRLFNRRCLRPRCANHGCPWIQNP